MSRTDYDLIIIGMGSAGMVGSEFAARMGLSVAVLERHRVGGDCLWTGCVPSKTLLASAKVAHHVRTAHEFGLPPAADTPVEPGRVWARVRAVQSRIATSDDDPERFRSLGIDVLLGDGEVVGPHEVRVAGRVLRARYILLCTGSRPAEPDIAGLREAGFLTSETLFEVERPPASVVVIGGGPIGVELAQGMQRLGIAATVLQQGPTILPRDEPDLVAALERVVTAEGVEVFVGVDAQRVERDGAHKVVHGNHRGAARSWAAEELVVATGRQPNIEGLGLAQVGVATSHAGVDVDDRMRTSVPSVYAAGDVNGRHQFTHTAAHEAVRAIRDMFFPGRGRVSNLVPWCTFTDPELAHVGLTESEARREHGEAVTTRVFDFAHSDRARTDGAEEGMIKVVLGRRGRLLGAHILSPAAGELIHEYALAINEGMKLARLANLIHVYPTLATAIGQLAAEAVFDDARRWRWLASAWKRVQRG